MIKVLSFLSNENWFVGHSRGPCGPRFEHHCCSGTFRKCLRRSWNPMQWSVSKLLQRHRTVAGNFDPGNFGLFRRSPGSHLWNPEVPRNPGWKALLYGISFKNKETFVDKHFHNLNKISTMAIVTVLSWKIRCCWLNNWISHWCKLLSFRWRTVMQDTLGITPTGYEDNFLGFYT